MTTRAEIIAVARSWIGTPYRHQASVKGVGADCIGLLRGISLESRIIAPEIERRPEITQFKGYGTRPVPGELGRLCAMLLDPVAIDSVQIADVLLLRWDTDPQHLAIVSSLSPMRIIHSFSSARRVCENGVDGAWRHDISWRSLIDSAWRYRDLTD